MSRLLALPALLMSALPLAAEPLTPVTAEGDWNADGFPDRLIVRPDGEGEADILLYEGREGGGEEQVIALEAVVWAGPMAGQEPAIVTGDPQAFAIFTQNDAIGRNRWSEELQIDYREGDYYVTAFSYGARDTIDETYLRHCAVNFLSGDYDIQMNGESFGPAAPIDAPFLLADLPQHFFPDACMDLVQ